MPLSVSPDKLEADWAASCSEIILRRCPLCGCDLITRTSPQAGARCTPRLDRGSARSLPWLREDLHLPPAVFSPLYSLQFADARSGIAAAPVEHCSWDEATPTLKDPNRVPDASTLRRWARGLDHSQPAFSFLRQTLSNIAHWLVLGHSADPRAGPLSSLHSVLPILWPLRL
jgi:hypothetical protein